ncbi:hypothetical protein BD779DRAFT_582935 [Infundibulicybe gibba]|nr:hypothetical protein BD779DRAFT_582935 [Infundibulicybe gibba]
MSQNNLTIGVSSYCSYIIPRPITRTPKHMNSPSVPMLTKTIRLSFVASSFLLSTPRAAAQISWSKDGPTASCFPGTLQWAFNTLNQSPCIIAQFLLNACNTSEFLHIPPIPVSSTGYRISSPTPCTCNTVFYSVLSACAACQRGSFRTWSNYSSSCSSPSFETLPEGVPYGTRVPHYAFHDVLVRPPAEIIAKQRNEVYCVSSLPTGSIYHHSKRILVITFVSMTIAMDVILAFLPRSTRGDFERVSCLSVSISDISHCDLPEH